LLIIQILWPFHHRFATLPSNLAVLVLGTAVVCALVAGTPRVRWAIVMALCVLAYALFLVAIRPGFMAPMTGSTPDPTADPIVAAAIVAFLVASAALGVRATPRELRET
jgi:hypothetical protein